MNRRCLDCPAVIPKGSRCGPCHKAYRAKWDGGDWERIARAAVAAHVEAFGYWCPGWRVDPHASTDLTADHLWPGSLSRGVLVMCRACNGRKGSRQDPNALHAYFRAVRAWNAQ